MTAAALSLRLAAKTVEALDICSFELVDPEGRALPSFSAGSHIDVHLDNGLIRQYSLANNPRETHRYLITVLRDANSRGGSRAMHELGSDRPIRVSAPRNHFPLAKEASHSILLAGGIGITPILCMAEQLSDEQASFELHYCTRSMERTAFVERIRQAPYASRTQFHFDNGPDAQRFNAEAVLGQPKPDVHLYVCGPTGFMDWILGTARAAGWPEERLHREYFAGGPTAKAGDHEFEIQIASTGAVIPVLPDQSVVSALAAHGIEVQTSCEQGVCGTCLTRIIDGEPDHRDLFLTPDEQSRGDQFTPCCSRSKSPRLVLDL